MRGVRLQLVLVTAAALLLLLFSSLAFPNGRLGQTIEIDTNYIHGHQNTQELEKQKGVLYGLILIVLGIACCALSASTGGSDVQDFVSRLLMGLSIAEMLAGIAVIGKKLLRG